MISQRCKSTVSRPSADHSTTERWRCRNRTTHPSGRCVSHLPRHASHGTVTGRWKQRGSPEVARGLDALARLGEQRDYKRSAERIAPLLFLMQQAWLGHPDLRFGQLVAILDGLRLSQADAFNAEDGEWLEALKRFEGVEP